MGETSGEESFTYGWGIGHPEHSVADHAQEVATEELFWVRGVLPHTFYADQDAAADLLNALLTDERIDYEDRYLLASIQPRSTAIHRCKSPGTGTTARNWTTGSSSTRQFGRGCERRLKPRAFTGDWEKTGRSATWKMSDIEEKLEETLPTRVDASTTDVAEHLQTIQRWDVTGGSKT